MAVVSSCSSVNLKWISINGELINRYFRQIYIINNVKGLNFHFAHKYPDNYLNAGYTL